MANNPKRTAAVANAAADAAVALADGGKLRIYSGSQPATAATAVSGQTLLAELTLGSPAFGAASNGVATANSITADSSADATGTAAWFRVVSSGGTGLWDGSVATSGADLNLDSVSIVAGGNVSVSSFTFTESLG
jgi:hypothetical protein